MTTEITLDNIEDLAIGSAFLGTGGGGDPYLGMLLCREALTKYGPVKLVSVDDLADADNVFVAAAIGAPTVMIEKLFSVEDQHYAVNLLEQYLGRSANAIISAEIGGCNSMMPVAYAAMRGLPLVDGDGMGRAFPELQMTAMAVNGISVAPMTLADEHGNSLLIQTKDAKKAERLARPVVAEMGASLCMSCYPMTGTEARTGVVRDTISAALSIGKAVRNSGDNASSAIERLVGALQGHNYYRDAYRLFDGKITEIERNTSKGWVTGRCMISALFGQGEAELIFRNENLVMYVDGQLRCVVPDLITVVDQETGHAIPTERLAYGQRVAVIGCSAPPPLKTEAALKVMGPQEFGLGETYVPIRQLMEKH
ncbi:DUF917 domain-containing protein [Kordiimonas marina]|uniref:DUF917 domain-containing protein n=1 Tax=Kordiimonas marina TaxID=2872312 RepID=UPI001FF3910C|nr:DUF917 domain-containing protein [Kordiimonas marina]MCJ9430614.1 DUF917 domain-containing protein [Kordiimonas marina]